MFHNQSLLTLREQIAPISDGLGFPSLCACPCESLLRQSQSTTTVLGLQRRQFTGIALLHGIFRQCRDLEQNRRNGDTIGQPVEQIRQIVTSGHVDAMVHQDSFDGLFCCLLRMEAKVLIEQCPGFSHASQGQIASCMPQPIPDRSCLWHLRRHRPLSPVQVWFRTRGRGYRGFCREWTA